MESFSSKQFNASISQIVDQPHVLLVDDDPNTLNYLGTMFGACKCLVSTSVSERVLQILEYIYAHRTKLNMICVNYKSSESGLNGYELLVQFKRSGSAAKDVPVVIYCHDPNPDQQIELNNCMIAGASMVFEKSLIMLAEVVDLMKRIQQ
ncbi:hypothetical protein CASFOL_003069 [Castilleja foliolosa]|uniref:Response regulatory domain-containing protein n=1 Tax=Castilleja foliolosa TaxID=1961234 RepID=A0ABD3EGD9_9LAMI